MKDPARADRSRYEVDIRPYSDDATVVYIRSTCDDGQLRFDCVAEFYGRDAMAVAQRWIDAEVAYHSSPDPKPPVPLECEWGEVIE